MVFNGRTLQQDLKCQTTARFSILLLFNVFSPIEFFPIVIYSFLFSINLKTALLGIDMGFQALEIQKISANLDVFGKKQRDLVTIG